MLARPDDMQHRPKNGFECVPRRACEIPSRNRCLGPGRAATRPGRTALHQPRNSGETRGLRVDRAQRLPRPAEDDRTAPRLQTVVVASAWHVDIVSALYDKRPAPPGHYPVV